MNETTNTKGVIAAKAETKVSAKKNPKTMKDYIEQYRSEIAKALPGFIQTERFIRIAMTAAAQTPNIEECTPASFMGAMLTSAQLGLEPNTPLGQAYLIPYGKTCQFQIGYKGLIDLAYRSGEILYICAHCVYENDEFDFEYGIEPKLRHKPAKGDKGKMIWVYAVYKLKNGTCVFEVMRKEDVEQHGKDYSKSFSNGPWKTAFEEMAKKTVLKKLLKYAPLKTEYTEGAADDGNSFEFENGEIRTVYANEGDIIDESEVQANE